MKNDEDVLPPSLSPIGLEDPMMSSDGHPMLKAQLEEEKNSVYSIMYSVSWRKMFFIFFSRRSVAEKILKNF